MRTFPVNFMGEQAFRLQNKAAKDAKHTIFTMTAILLQREARHSIMSLSGHRSESSIRSYSKTDESTKKRMSETLTAAAVSEVLAVSSESQLAERHVPVSPILSLSQEEHIMGDDHLSSHWQVKKWYTIHNCNVIFN